MKRPLSIVFSLITIMIIALSGKALGQEAQVILSHCAQVMGSAGGDPDIMAQGYMRINGSDSAISIVVKTRGLRAFRLETGSGGTADVSIVAGGRGWQYQQGTKKSLPSHAVAYFRPDHLPGLICGSALNDHGLRITYLGPDTVDLKPVFHLKLDAMPHGKDEQVNKAESLISEYHLFIDQQSFLVLKTAKYVFSPHAIENRSLWETLYSDYRNVNGMVIPFKIENLVSGQKFSTTIFEKVTTDVPLSDQEFNEVK